MELALSSSEASVSEEEAYDQSSYDADDAEDDTEGISLMLAQKKASDELADLSSAGDGGVHEHQANAIPDRPNPGSEIVKTEPEHGDTRTTLPEVVPDQAQKKDDTEDQPADDTGEDAAIAVLEASR
jgi:hypothetical protein